ncbi:MAG: hypothetical protein IKW30_00740 [Lachnospiraceae bacterium]|nr:hypothetical protein [Lachnospiraceae bacterium]
MKKLCSALLVMALTVAMVLPVFAAPSPQAEAKTAKSNATVAVAGADVKVLATDVHKEVINVVTNPTHLTNLGVSTAAKLAAAFDLKIEIPAGQASVSVPIKVNNAKVGDYAVILHRKADGQWEKVGEGFLAADMTVVGTFTSFSPVAVMVVDAAQASAAGVKAPKTGEF